MSYAREQRSSGASASAATAAPGAAAGCGCSTQCCVCFLGIKHVKYEHINLFRTHLNNAVRGEGKSTETGAGAGAEAELRAQLWHNHAIHHSLLAVRNSLFAIRYSPFAEKCNQACRHVERNVQQQQEHLQQAGKEARENGQGGKGVGGQLGPWVVQGQLTDGFSLGLTAQAVTALAFPNTDSEERRGEGGQFG